MYDPWIDKIPIIFTSPMTIFIGINHDEFRNYRFPEKSIIIDPWRIIEDQKNVKIIRIGINKMKISE